MWFYFVLIFGYYRTSALDDKLACQAVLRYFLGALLQMRADNRNYIRMKGSKLTCLSRAGTLLNKIYWHVVKTIFFFQRLGKLLMKVMNTFQRRMHQSSVPTAVWLKGNKQTRHTFSFHKLMLKGLLKQTGELSWFVTFHCLSLLYYFT